MPSPFPGMDPYLEDPVLWPGLHQRLITDLSTALNASAPAHYVTNIGERVYVIGSERDIIPDASLLERLQFRPRPAPGTGERDANGIDRPVIVTDEAVRVRELFLEVRSVRPPREVVAVIELLSPTNKLPGVGRNQYLSKQEDVLRSQAHLIEIDLLRVGLPTVAAPASRIRERAEYNYLVCLHRAGVLRHYETWPVTLRQPLPCFAVPLSGSEPDVAMNLQALFTRGYEEGAYDRQVDYTADPAVPLAPADAAWADALLRSRGLRPNPHGGPG